MRGCKRRWFTAVFALSVAGMTLLSGSVPSGRGSAVPSTGSRFSLANTDRPIGDMVGFRCLNATIYLNGSLTCHDSNLTFQNLGTGFHNYTVSATSDHGYAVNQWNATGSACFGSNSTCLRNVTNNPAAFWSYCAPTGYCSGAVVLSNPPIKAQVLTARIYNGSGSMTVNGTPVTDGQTIALEAGSVVSVDGTSDVPGLTFWGWLSDDGQFLHPRSSMTTLTVRNAPTGVGNVTLLLNGTPLTNGLGSGWAGLEFSGAGFTEVSATFTIPNVAYNPNPFGNGAPSNVGIWVGIGGGRPLGETNLWQAGVCVVNDSSYPNANGLGSAGLAAYAFYETWPQANPQYNNAPLTVGSTVTVSVGFNPANSTSTFKLVCDSDGGIGCGWSSSTWSRQVNYTPNASTCEWIAEDAAIYSAWSLWDPSSISAAGPSASFSGSAEVWDAYTWGHNGKVWDVVASVTASGLTLMTV